ncbi:hypothetical protein Ptr902_02843 [Pyrenophora tritici-repentis]|nr:hypothetical protein Ptr902_02843 [Pyrenophora tritici-repentis]
MLIEIFFLVSSFLWLAAAKDVPGVAVREMGAKAEAPASVITPAPIVHGDLFKRAIATCGFIRGNSASAVTCPQDYNCITTKSAFACCNNVECKGNWGFCRPYGESGCNGFDLPESVCASIYGSILQCSSEAPNCVQYARSAALGDPNTYYSLTCGTATEAILVLATPTNGAAAPTGNSNSNGGGVVLDSGSSIVVPGLNVPVATNTSPSGATGGSSSGGSSSSGGGGGSPISVTAIALISVAGAGVLFFALLIGYCCWWRRSRRKKREALYPSQPPQLKGEGTVTTGPGPGSVVSWNLQTPTGADPNIAPSHKSVSEFGDFVPPGNQPFRPMGTLHEKQSQRSFGWRSS